MGFQFLLLLFGNTPEWSFSLEIFQSDAFIWKYSRVEHRTDSYPDGFHEAESRQ